MNNKEIKGVIIRNPYNHYESMEHQISRLKEEAKNLNITLDVLDNDGTLITLEHDDIVNHLNKKYGKVYNFVIYLDKDKYLSQLLEISGLRLFNSSKAIELCDDKMLTHIALAKKGITMPKTIASSLCYVKDSQVSIDTIDKIIQELGLPCVVKENFGSLGEQVYLAHTKEELIDLANKLMYKPHLYQEFIQASYGSDIRCIVVGHQVIAAMNRRNSGDFRANIGQGGTAYPIEINHETEQMAIKASEILGLDYCGVDILMDGEKPYLCEVNSNAFFKGIESLTQVNVAKAYLEYVLSVI